MSLQAIAKDEGFCQGLGVKPGSVIDFTLLGQGEYNINYLFMHPSTGEKLVLRTTTGSQMHLKNQIRYEFDSLGLLEASGRTPKPLYIDDGKRFLPGGFLVMEFLPGQALCYDTDLTAAADCLADIHNISLPEQYHLIAPENPLEAILAECEEMAAVYFAAKAGKADIKQKIRNLLDSGEDILSKGVDKGGRCIVNTELNSGNFLINGGSESNYLIDWEKPLFSFAGQDLGHFLAPTTTFWKTDTILKKESIDGFIADYCRRSKRFDNPALLWAHALPYFAMTCLRGITWCAMAWVEYQSPDRPIQNSDTYEKICAYLTPDFLDMIRSEYIGG